MVLPFELTSRFERLPPYPAMQFVDTVIIVIYLVGIIFAGSVFAGRMKSTREMFSANGQSPWWVSGLSGFMTMFSAGTFVIWGGIAYRFGLVAVAINMCYGIAALLVGWFVAGRWRKLGVASAAEFLQLRFGGSVVQFYTWFQGTIGLCSIGGAVYALSKMVCALIPLPEGHLLADAATGQLSVPLTSITLCLLVIIITYVGGLWAVLMTDVLQFVILLVSVVFVVPLILGEVGGWGQFWRNAPEGFAALTTDDFTWWFLTGWVLIHFFKIGGEWAFVQRYTCVPTSQDAKKAALLFGVMYLVSPMFWMIPPLVYRVINPHADHEQAYILACQLVLPPGMLGLMIAAMASATASMATTQINVFAGAFTTEYYQRFINRAASEARLVGVGRIFTVLLGLMVMVAALLIPRYGYTRFVIDVSTLMTGPLVLPTIWGLFSRKIDLKAVWITTFVGFATAVVVKFGFATDGFLTGISGLGAIEAWIEVNRRTADLVAGILVPFLVLVLIELGYRTEAAGWQRVETTTQSFSHQLVQNPLALPAKMVAITLGVLAFVMGSLILVDSSEASILAIFATTLLLLAIGLWTLVRRHEPEP